MKIGLQVVAFNWGGSPQNTGAKLAEIAHTADDAGFASLWVMDHFFQLEGVLGPADDPMLESYSALSYMAAVTKNIRLGTLVTGVIYREPSLLIKTVTNLDVLSSGRAYFGVGAAWYEKEARGLGFPFPPTKNRFEMLEETLQIAKQMWAGNTSAYNGKHYQLDKPILSPPALSQPHPPIMIGGMGEKKTLRMVAQYADACNLFARAGTDVLKNKLDILKQHCDALGRDYEEIERTSLDTVHIAAGQMTARDVVQRCKELADVGIQHAIFNMPNTPDITPIEVFGRDIIPAVAEL